MNQEKPIIKPRESALNIKPAKVNKNMRDYSKDPFVVKKAEAAKKHLKKLTLPKVLTGKK